METWAIVTLVLGTSVVSALLTFFITKMQVSHSDKRLEKQIVSAREADYQQRRREVRGEPLLKLRIELANMASKQDKLAAAAYRQLNIIGVTEEQARAELQSAVDDWNTYVASGDFAQTLFMQCDAELVNKIEGIRKDYQESNFVALYFQIVKDAAKLSEAMKVIEKNKARIIEVQELINKRLEAL